MVKRSKRSKSGRKYKYSVKPTSTRGRMGARAFGRSMPNTVLRTISVKRPVFGLSYSTKMIYADRSFSLAPVAGNVDAHIFSANAIYDPDISGTGHRASGFDQMMEFYNHYIVTSSKMIVTFHNEDTTAREFVGISLLGGTTVGTYATMMEGVPGVYQELNVRNNTGDMGTLDLECDVSDFLGVKDLMSEDQVRGTVTTNPAEQVYFAVWASPIAPVTPSSAVGFTLRIEYQVTFTEPRRILTA